MPLLMMNTIEVRDKYNRANDQSIGNKILTALIDLNHCPRQTVRFFHRRNSCDCLQELYDKLKETTKKTSLCRYCRKMVETKQLSRCEYCNIVHYCSYDCALANWTKHKVECEILGYYKPNRPAKSEHDLEEVD